MSRIEDNYPTPIQGVSTLTSRNRARGQAGVQLNMRSDPVKKLTRRPSLQFGTVLLDSSSEVTLHSYYRRERDIQLLIDTNGLVYGYVNGIEKVVVGNIDYYAQGPLKLETINDTTFVVNTDETVQMLGATDSDTALNVTHINVVSALNYGETLIIQSEGSPAQISVSITIPPATSQTAADEARRTNAVAEAIALQINLSTGITAVAKGSAVAVYRTASTNSITLFVEAGNGDDDVVIFNTTTESIAGLPLYAIPNTLLTVKPDPSTSDGTYYLKATPLEESPLGTTVIQEVVWTESRSPSEKYSLNENTMPHTIRYDYVTDQFIIGTPELGWEDRLKGDNESCPVPAFVGRPITSIGQFQKRLVFISDNDVEMTVTDNLFNWWKQSAIELLVTDPISVTSNSTGIDVLQHVIEHNRDLLIIASNGQFKIDGTQGITPQTVAMPLTTSQEIQISVPPISIGSSIFMPINYGDSTGVTEYTGARDQSDIAQPVTHHVIGYMEGEAKLMAGSPNLEMIAMTTTGSPQNVLFIYEQFTDQGKKLQTSWSTWELPENLEILHIAFRRDKLVITVKDDVNRIVLKTIDMYSRVGINTDEVFLDELLPLTSDGVTVELPLYYPSTSDVIIVGGDNTKYPLFKVKYTRAGGTVTFDENITKGGNCTVYVGKPYRSAYQPTRPFRLDESNIAITTDRIRINRYVLSVVDTERVTMTTLPKYTESTDQTKTFRVLNSLTNKIGEVNLFTGDFQFSYGQNAEHSDVEFWTEGWLGLTIAGISWKGQYFRTSGRL
jgi:hypothetical protein